MQTKSNAIQKTSATTRSKESSDPSKSIFDAKSIAQHEETQTIQSSGAELSTTKNRIKSIFFDKAVQDAVDNLELISKAQKYIDEYKSNCTGCRAVSIKFKQTLIKKYEKKLSLMNSRIVRIARKQMDKKC